MSNEPTIWYESSLGYITHPLLELKYDYYLFGSYEFVCKRIRGPEMIFFLIIIKKRILLPNTSHSIFYQIPPILLEDGHFDIRNRCLKSKVHIYNISWENVFCVDVGIKRPPPQLPGFGQKQNLYICFHIWVKLHH